MSASADDQYEQQNDVVSGDVPAGDSSEYFSKLYRMRFPDIFQLTMTTRAALAKKTTFQFKKMMHL